MRPNWHLEKYHSLYVLVPHVFRAGTHFVYVVRVVKLISPCPVAPFTARKWVESNWCLDAHLCTCPPILLLSFTFAIYATHKLGSTSSSTHRKEQKNNPRPKNTRCCSYRLVRVSPKRRKFGIVERSTALRGAEHSTQAPLR